MIIEISQLTIVSHSSPDPFLKPFQNPLFNLKGRSFTSFNGSLPSRHLIKFSRHAGTASLSTNDSGLVSGKKSSTSRNSMLIPTSAETTLLPKIEYLQNLGLTYEEVGNMVIRSPALLTFSIRNNLMPKVEYFLGEMNGDIAELKRFPKYFSYSLEKKIKPRHNLLVKQRFSLPLADMLKVIDGEFNARLIEMRLRSLEGN